MGSFKNQALSIRTCAFHAAALVSFKTRADVISRQIAAFGVRVAGVMASAGIHLYPCTCMTRLRQCLSMIGYIAREALAVKGIETAGAFWDAWTWIIFETCIDNWRKKRCEKEFSVQADSELWDWSALVTAFVDNNWSISSSLNTHEHFV